MFYTPRFSYDGSKSDCTSGVGWCTGACAYPSRRGCCGLDGYGRVGIPGEYLPSQHAAKGGPRTSEAGPGSPMGLEWVGTGAGIPMVLGTAAGRSYPPFGPGRSLQGPPW